MSDIDFEELEQEIRHEIATLGTILGHDIRAYGLADPRSVQSREGILGPSDLGFCRQKAALTTRGVPDSDEKSIAAAQIGTAIHRYVAKAFAASHPDWIVEGDKVTATFPSGATVAGTPDIIAPDWNAVVDVKTVDGFSWVKREGTSLNHKMQRYTYATGAIQEGLLDGAKTVWVCNLYIDRSGKEPEPYFTFEEYDPTFIHEIDSWIQDVIYAVKTGEDASRDIPAPVCEQICEKFTVCRGSLEVHDGGELISDKGLIHAIEMYIEGRDMAKTGEQMKREASTMLYGVNGTDGRWQVRWTDVAPSAIEAYERQGYKKIDVRKARS
jgi:hypothetical protein